MATQRVLDFRQRRLPKASKAKAVEDSRASEKTAQPQASEATRLLARCKLELCSYSLV